MSPDRVTAVVVTYGDRVDLCLRTVRAALDAGAGRAIVVTNGVTPLITRRLSDELPPAVRTVPLADNYGSAGGFRVGLEEAIAAGSEAAWLLDDDNLPAPDCLDRLLAALRARRVAAVVAFRQDDPMLVRARDGLELPPAGSFLYVDIAQRLADRRRAPVPRPLPPLPYAPYGGLLLDEGALALGVLPDPALVLYEDDTDFTSRLRAAGASLELVPDAVIEDADAKWRHPGAGRATLVFSDAPQRQYYAVRNRVAYDVRTATSLVTRLRLVLNALAYVAVGVATGSRRGGLRSFRVFAAAVRDGRGGRTGLAPNRYRAAGPELAVLDRPIRPGA